MQDYRVAPFIGSSTGALRPGEVARQLETLLNDTARDRPAFAALGPISITVSPGCLGGLLGRESSRIQFDQLVMGPLRDSDVAPIGAAMPGSRAPQARAVSSAEVAVPLPASGKGPGAGSGALGKIAKVWGGLSGKARLGVGIAAVLLFWWLMPSGRPPEVERPQASAPSPLPRPAAPPMTSQAPKTAPAADTAPAPAARPPATAAPPSLPPAASRQVAAPALRVGDRWVTDVVDHQDARLNYRSERIVQSVDGGRVVTSVRTLKNNYTRAVEYDGQWSLLAARLPNGSTTTYEPALPYLQFPVSPGQRWQARVVETKADGTQRVHEVRAIVEGWEPVAVPAGQFDALRIVLNDDVSEGGVLVSQGQDVSWYVPEVRRSVKSEETSLTPNTGERRRRTIELVEYTLR